MQKTPTDNLHYVIHQTMHVEHITVTVRELTQDYKKHPEINQVTAYGEKLNIRPAYQREFIYKPHQQEAVIQTILKGFPLNIMYWAKTGDDTWEVLDGQQRTLSICEYCGIIGTNGIRSGTFSVKLPGRGDGSGSHHALVGRRTHLAG